MSDSVRKRPQHPPETGASWEVVERRRLISALRKQSQRILGRRFIVNKIYKVVENSQNWMVASVDSYLWMFLSHFLCFCRTQLQKLRILKIHFNLTLLFVFPFLFFFIFTEMYRRKITSPPAQTPWLPGQNTKNGVEFVHVRSPSFPTA